MSDHQSQSAIWAEPDPPSPIQEERRRLADHIVKTAGLLNQAQAEHINYLGRVHLDLSTRISALGPQLSTQLATAEKTALGQHDEAATLLDGMIRVYDGYFRSTTMALDAYCVRDNKFREEVSKSQDSIRQDLEVLARLYQVPPQQDQHNEQPQPAARGYEAAETPVLCLMITALVVLIVSGIPAFVAARF
ncbi:hypothetical protein GGR52DRAFT_592449 [Hypoxylon sp. FL1284]|nr:hypothetical protein GGR52DRAFT_592449 [Hypoxylon sp. FL1284]